MKLIVGLGNIGSQYKDTRHNMGFMVVDKLSDILNIDLDNTKFNGDFGYRFIPELNEKVFLAKPNTFMNNSGDFIRPLMDYFGIDIDDLIVVYDDMAINEGEIRLRLDGSSGGHNGIKSIISHLGTDKFKRVRIGIGEPSHSGIDYVLSKPAGEHLELTNLGIQKGALAVKDALLHDFVYSMNHYNGKEK